MINRWGERVSLQNASVHRDLVGQAIFGDDVYGSNPVERHDSRNVVLRKCQVVAMNTVDRFFETNESTADCSL
jgi:hypothetical protein